MALLTTSLVTVVEDDNLGEVPSSLKEELAKLASQRMPSGVLMYWYQLIKGQDAIAPARVNETLASDVHVAIDAASPAYQAVQPHPTYPCPWCTVELKLPKDFIRHVKQKCSATEVYHCPDCSKTFTRKQRFAKHHNTVHAFRCGRGPCKHIKKATVALPQVRTLGCGFCKQLFHSDLHGYLRHLIGHYREGLTLTCWKTGPFVPACAEHMRPPQIMLDAEVTDHSVDDFSALRSGFGLPSDFEWFESAVPADRSSTPHEHDQSGKILADNLVENPWWQSEIALPCLASD